MPRGRFFAIVLLPLLAALLAAQPAMAQFNIFEPAAPAAKPTPAKPAPPAQQKKTAPAAAPAKPVTAPAPAAAQKKPAAKKVEPPKYTLADYFRVWGVSGTTTRAEIVARFGEPQRVGDSARKPFYYFNGALTFFFTSDDTVSTMIVGNSFEPLPPNSIPPDVIDKAFIGRKRDDVLKAFGPAQVVSSEN